MTTLLDRLWDAHEIMTDKDGRSLLWVDRHLVHEGSHHAFAKLDARGSRVAEPSLTFGVVDHYAPTHGPAASPAINPDDQDTRAQRREAWRHMLWVGGSAAGNRSCDRA